MTEVIFRFQSSGVSWGPQGERKFEVNIHISVFLKEIILICQLTPRCRVFLEKLIVTRLVNKFYSFLEPECLLMCSQKSATGPHS
jgi:hypothetical protein